jgi:phospholipid-binding lipoprotein MlaA
VKRFALAALARLALPVGLGLALAAGGEPALPAEAVEDTSAADLLLEEEYDAAAVDHDPLEPSNRLFFRGNEVLYRRLFDPLADVYAFVFPGPVRRSFVRFFQNLGEPADFLNELLQLNPRFAGRTGARFVLNTTVGVLGLLDPATGMGFPARATDFGETLGAYGVGQGWYLVVPLLGPSTVRDLFGDVVDGFFHPQAYFLGYTTQILLATGSGFSRYEAEREQLDALRQSSLDFYTALRSAYRMQRAASVREARAESPVLRHLGDGAATAAVAAPAGVE